MREWSSQEQWTYIPHASTRLRPTLQCPADIAHKRQIQLENHEECQDGDSRPLDQTWALLSVGPVGLYGGPSRGRRGSLVAPGLSQEEALA